MAHIVIKYDCRAPEGVSTMSVGELYDTTLEQVAWMDTFGLPLTINFCEHHGSEDGYLPSPIALATAAARMTRNVRLQVNVILPFHNPLRIAEDVAVLDQLSNGRAEVLLLGGYVAEEMAMFGVDPKQRGMLMEEGVIALKSAWTGEAFQYRGRPCRIRPQPVQDPHPPIFMGGTGAAAARRAARLGDGFIGGLPELNGIYLQECQVQGKLPRFYGKSPYSQLFVSEDPDRLWQKLVPYCLYETNSYARWQAGAALDALFQEAADADAVRALGIYNVATPQEVLAVLPTMAPNSVFCLHPLIAGFNKDLSWEGLRLFFEQIVPRMEFNLI